MTKRKKEGESASDGAKREALAQSALTISAALAVAILLILFLSGDPLDALSAFFLGPLKNPYLLGNMLRDMSLLTLTGLGAAFAFKGGAFNLGGEGQVYAGGFVATMICLELPGLPGFFGGTMGLLVGAATGAILAGLSGVLKAKLRVDELISSFLLSSALLPCIDFALGGPVKDQASNMLATKAISSSYAIPSLSPPSKFNLLFLVAIGIALCLWIFLSRTRQGYAYRVSGMSPPFARFAGIKPELAIVGGMAMSGALNGLAGAGAVMGSSFLRCQAGFAAGMGWNGIAVALIARNSPIGVPFAALAFSWIKTGSDSAMLSSGFSADLGSIVQAAVFLLVTARFAFSIWGKRRRP